MASDAVVHDWMGVCEAIDHWGSTPEERVRRYPCDDIVPEHQHALFRAVTVDAPAAALED